jgi:hypothetical protein
MFTQVPSDQINGSTNIKSQTTKVPASPVKINKNEQKKKCLSLSAKTISDWCTQIALLLSL